MSSFGKSVFQEKMFMRFVCMFSKPYKCMSNLDQNMFPFDFQNQYV